MRRRRGKKQLQTLPKLSLLFTLFINAEIVIVKKNVIIKMDVDVGHMEPSSEAGDGRQPEAVAGKHDFTLN